MYNQNQNENQMNNNQGQPNQGQPQGGTQQEQYQQPMQGNYQNGNGMPPQQGQPMQQPQQTYQQPQGNGMPPQQGQPQQTYQQPQGQPMQEPQGNGMPPQQQGQQPNMTLPDMTPPTGGGGEDKLEVPKLGAGQFPATLIQIIDLGTHENTNYNNKNKKVRLTFEFPLHKHKWYENDEQLRPSLVSTEETYSMSDKANLRKLVAGLMGVHIKDESLNKFNISSLLGKKFMLNLTPNQKGYDTIQSGSPINYNYFPNADLSTVNDLLIFFIPSHGFNNPIYGEVPGFLKKRKYNAIEESEEAINHKNNGGTFYEKPKDNNEQQTSNNNNRSAAQTVEQTNYGNQTVNQGQQPVQQQQPQYHQPQHNPSGSMNTQGQGQPQQNQPNQPMQQPQGNGMPPQQGQPMQQPQQNMGNANYDPSATDDDDLPF